ncbi:MAG: 3-isopropylmalate dehydrogenase [Legionellales bacterium]|nr:3-isopropylmalate dehydrogenase [Legionellales bacterium]
MTEEFQPKPFQSAKQEISKIKTSIDTENTLAFLDQDFLLRDELRPVRVQLELWRPELVLCDNEIDETFVFFGSSKTPTPEYAQVLVEEAEHNCQQNPDDKNYRKQLKHAQEVLANSHFRKEATKLAYLVSQEEQLNLFVVTGGGPGFMESANQGAHEAGKPSLAFNMMLPHEQTANPFVTHELTFQFHYFAMRKMHFLVRAKAVAAFPGGFGTMDELFEVLTLMQTKKIERLPLVLFRKAFWDQTINFTGLVEQGTIHEQDLDLIHFAETAEQGWEIIKSALLADKNKS